MGRKKKIDEAVIEAVEEKVEATEEAEAIQEQLAEEESKAAAQLFNDRLMYNDDLGFSIVQHLTAEEIEAIADFVGQYNTWSDRYYAKGIVTLNVATDLTTEEVTNIVSSVDMIANPFIESVYQCIINWHNVEQALEYYSSLPFKLDQLLNALRIYGEMDSETIGDNVKDMIANARKDAEEK